MIEITIDKRNATTNELATLDKTAGYTALLSELIMHGRSAGISLTILEAPPKGFAFKASENIVDGTLNTFYAGSNAKGKTSLKSVRGKETMTVLSVKAVNESSGTTVFEDTADNNDAALQKAMNLTARFPACSIRYQYMSQPGWTYFGQIRWAHLIVQGAYVSIENRRRLRRLLGTLRCKLNIARMRWAYWRDPDYWRHVKNSVYRREHHPNALVTVGATIAFFITYTIRAGRPWKPQP